MNYFERRRSANLSDRPKTKGAPRLTHGAPTRRRGGHVSSAASETLFALALLRRILKSTDAIRRGNGEKSSSHPAKQERNLRGKVSLRTPTHFEHLTTGLIAATWGAQKSKKPKNKMNTTKTLIAGAAVAGLMAGSLPVRAYAASAPTQAGVSLQTLAEREGHAFLQGTERLQRPRRLQD